MIRISRRIVVGAFVFVLTAALPNAAQQPLVEIYLIRHPETEPAPSNPRAIHLTEVGRQRAALLVTTFAGVRVSHLFASHTVRALETLEHIARDRSLPVVQLPPPGSMLNGQVVTDEVSRREAINPVADALLALPLGSVAVVALNSENIYAVLNRLGIPEAQPNAACSVGQWCVPCLNNTCFPRDAFDRLWYVARKPGEKLPLVFSELRYGAGWSPARNP